MPVLRKIYDDLSSGTKSGWNQSLNTPPGVHTPDVPAAESLAYKVGDTAGAIAAGAVGDKARRFVWLHNHQLGTQASIGYGLGDAINARVAKEDGGRFIHPALLASGLSLGVLPVLSGNMNPLNPLEGGRVAGYSAVFPDVEDPTKTTNVAAEFGARYFLGRKGKLLTPSQGFFEERPDVSAEEYAKATNDLGYMGKGFFGMEKNRLASAVLGSSLGALAGAGPGHLVDRAVYGEKLKPGVGKRAKIGGLAGAIAGSMLPEIVQTGFLKGGSNLDGVPTIAQLGYEVPLPALGATLALAAGARYAIPAMVKKGMIKGHVKKPGQEYGGLKPSLQEQAREIESREMWENSQYS